MVQVVNKRRVSPRAGDIYIGRPSPWGNPFQIGRDGTRAEVIEKYRAWVTPDLVEQLRQLNPSRLVCWCAPAPCHGGVLAELLEGEGI